MSLSNTGLLTVSGGAGAGITTSGALNISGPINRTSLAGGWLSGNFGSTETAATPNCIYTIGGGIYVPGTTTLGTMYGIGYACANAALGLTAIPGVGASLWGMYVAAGGNPSIFLEAAGGGGYFKGPLSATNLSLSGTGSLLQLGSKFSWSSTYTAIDMGTGGGIFSSGVDINLVNNVYLGGATPAWKLKTQAAASYLQIAGGAFYFYVAPSGNAGAAPAWLNAMSISNTGVLGLPAAVVGAGSPAAGSAGALPSAPVGYLQLSIAGTLRWIPFYA
jgi:hypothetical protein